MPADGCRLLCERILETKSERRERDGGKGGGGRRPENRPQRAGGPFGDVPHGTGGSHG